MTSDFGEIRKQIAADRDKLTEQIAKKCAEEWSDLVEECSDELNEASEKAETAAEQLEKSVGELQSALLDCGRIVESASGMGEKAAAMMKASEELCRDMDRFKTAVDDFVREQNSVSEMAIAQLKESFEKIIQEIQFGSEIFSGELNTAGDRIRVSMESSAGEIQGYCRKLAEGFQRYSDQTEKGIQWMENARQEISQTSLRIKEAEEAVKEKLADYKEYLSQDCERLAEFKEQIVSGSGTIEELIRSFQSKSCQTGERLEELSKKAGEYLEHLEASCNAMDGLLQIQKEKDQQDKKKEMRHFYLLAAMLAAMMIVQMVGLFF